MKIFITGATGYIGQRVMARLLNQGHDIHALCRRKPDGELFNNPRVKIFEGDVVNSQKVRDAISDCDQAYHIAAYSRIWAKDVKTFFETNVQGTTNVLEAALQAGVKKVVVTSTGGTYGTNQGQLISETTVRLTDFFDEYESSKFMAEEKVHAYVRRGLAVVIVNPVRVYGPGVLSESNALSHLIKEYVTGSWHIIPGNGETIGSFTYIDNVVEGHILAMEKGVSGEGYILGGINADFNTFFSTLSKISDRHFFLVRVPMAWMLLYCWKEELLAKWFGIEPTITRKWIRKYNHNVACSSEKAITELGYNITTLEEGIERTLTWIREDLHIHY
jgi:NAD+-dependent farnesol dehydrogenase